MLLCTNLQELYLFSGAKMKNTKTINSFILAVMSCSTLFISSCAEPKEELEKKEFKKAELPESKGENLFNGLTYVDSDTKFVFSENTVMMYNNESEDENIINWQPSVKYNYTWNEESNKLYMAGTSFFNEGKEFTNPEDYYKYSFNIYTENFGNMEIPASAQNYFKSLTEKEFATYITFEYSLEEDTLNLFYIPSCKFRMSKSDNYYGTDQFFTYNLYGYLFTFTSKESLKEYILVPEFNGTQFSGTLLDSETFLPEGEIEGKYATISLTSGGRYLEAYTNFTFLEGPDVMKDIINKKIKLNFYCDKKYTLTKVSE